MNYSIVWPSIVLFGIGTAIGSFILLDVNTELLRKMIGWYILIFLPLPLLTRTWGIHPNPNKSAIVKNIGYALLIPLGIHSGLIGGGTSTLVTYVLISCFGQTYLESAGTRKPMLLGRGIIAAIILGSAGEIHWLLGMTMLIGTAIGTFFGTRYAIAKGNKWVRNVFIAVTALMAIKLLI